MKKFFLGFKYAFQGVVYAFVSQINFKFHSVAGLLVAALGLYYDISKGDWLWIITAIGIVLVAELLNTALEVLVDLVSPEYNKKAGIIKDLASAAVLITAIIAFVIGLLIFVPLILDA